MRLALRIAALVVLAGGLIAGMAHGLSRPTEAGAMGRGLLTYGGIAMALSAMLVAVSCMEFFGSEGRSSTAASSEGTNLELLTGIDQANQQLRRLVAMMDDVAASAHAGQAKPQASDEAMPTPTAAPMAQVDLAPVLQAIEEVRELALLDDAQRAELRAKVRQARRHQGLESLRSLIKQEAWAQAGEYMAALEVELGNDAEFQQVRSQMEQERSAAMTRSYGPMQKQVEAFVAKGEWDQALAAARDFLANFPDSMEGRILEQRVTRDWEMYRDDAVMNLYGQVKELIQGRHWRRCQTKAEELVRRFPGHVKTQKVSLELDSIRQNAEIEDRADRLKSIKTAVTGELYDNAVELAETFIEKWPTHPESDKLRTLLPALRGRAVRGDLMDTWHGGAGDQKVNL